MVLANLVQTFPSIVRALIAGRVNGPRSAEALHPVHRAWFTGTRPPGSGDARLGSAV
ncbi:MAG: hypothetical protein AVDCRST_MAG89-1880 [uncultured Gemmatimonadetes bacterium]|uniref:Uncharacterized protein n=1 Tax=uncultured Gemmatimonadota bacterium TaxID=203437 RepID=A0A6J4LAG3_9BACT|nr:MAG: hypothetical protein AVDCRST_MAG89-1880 [uncultured Gemmatimonadota bacterium]